MFVLDAGQVVELLDVVVEGVVVVASTQLNLEALVATDVGGQPERQPSRLLLTLSLPLWTLMTQMSCLALWAKNPIRLPGGGGRGGGTDARIGSS